MAKEIERKFRVVDGWRPPGEGTAYEQGYLSSVKERTVRVRREGDKGKLTIKGANQGISRAEYEYAIPVDDADVMLRDLCEQPTIAKRRHVVEHAGKKWEVDVFAGENAGLVIAELELASEDETFEKPDWVTDEVSDDPRYYNANLVKHPYQRWG
jgi:adenylate cyclase